jgi:alpha-L-arabinofuranosidase
VLLWYSKHRYDQQKWFRKQVHVDVGKVLEGSDVQVYLIDEDTSNGLTHPEKAELQTTENCTVKDNTLNLEMRPNSVVLLVLKPRG